MRTSSELTVGEVYTRDDLRRMFDITDSTINTGIFRPAGHSSIWLFVTEQKTSDRTQYRDRLKVDELEWDGQLSGRKDRQIAEHRQDGVELIVFYRRDRYEHPGSGFRYEGVFEYVSHTGGSPTHFRLRRVPRVE